MAFKPFEPVEAIVITLSSLGKAKQLWGHRVSDASH